MNKKLKTLAFICLLIPTIYFGQHIGSQKIDTTKVSHWQTKTKEEFKGVYHFGESEAESDLILIVVNDSCYAQLKQGSFSSDGKTWAWQYENLSKVRIEGNKFFSDKTNGEFVIYDNGNEKVKGLKVYPTWSGITENVGYEIGINSSSLQTYYPGKYTDASLKKLNADVLRKLPKSKLKMMRNEIFARYGFIFKAGGEMDLYFKKQKWYSAQHNNIENFLTSLEKENIQLILQIEKE